MPAPKERRTSVSAQDAAAPARTAGQEIPDIEGSAISV
jgi:hypothetical protein